MIQTDLNPVRQFLETQKQQIEKLGLRYSVPAEDVEKLFDELKKVKSEADAAVDTFQSLRYLSYFLADRANHSPAKVAAYWNNVYRTKHLRAIGHRKRLAKNVIHGVVNGYHEKPGRTFLAVALGIWLLFAAFFGCVSFFTGDDYTSIVFTNETTTKDPKWYHYCYFSAVTLTTLGYGDLAPNHSDSHEVAEFLMVAACSAEAVLGYIFLGIGVATIMRLAEAHPTARIDKMMDDYEERIGLTPPVEPKEEIDKKVQGKKQTES